MYGFLLENLWEDFVNLGIDVDGELMFVWLLKYLWLVVNVFEEYLEIVYMINCVMDFM